MTVAIVLIYLNALGNVGYGILVLLSRYRVPREDVLFTSLLGAALILVGLLAIAIASGLARGSRFARVLTTVYAGVLVGLNIVTLVSTDPWDVNALVHIVGAAAIVVVLWTPPGARYFVSAPSDVAADRTRAT